ncbi:MAG: DUF305 domain-containing protein [Oscillatoriophycideae cyanobacterium NC_groundwater_1537_Pr4_S-0.65um_50_18]|nr:DUF305 domain-containing protein [Oscillatoriophycideae cyanobacterium NC_groundwater_1537_Pr4_S-0.65um_50_18]
MLATSTEVAYSQAFQAQGARTQPAPLEHLATLPAAEEIAPHLAHSDAETAAETDAEAGDSGSAQAMPHLAMPGMEHEMPGMGHEMPSMQGEMPSMSHDSMSLGPEDEYFDLRFLDAMILHHQGAVNMAEEVLEKSDRLSLRKMAREIILVQKREVRRMQSWREAWYPDADQRPLMYVADKQQTLPMTQEMQDAMMMNMDMGSADEDFDLRFINAMLPHHQGAVAMAGEALLRSDRPDIWRLSQSILGVQQQEIAQLRTWRRQWYSQ